MIVEESIACLGHHHINQQALETLVFSDLNQEQLEALAQKSSHLTKKRFGHVMQLYTPLYLSNECVNTCTYCGFSQENKIPRITLSVEETVKESVNLYEQGIRHILLVAGEHPRHITVDYVCDVVSQIKNLFASISIEIAPLQESEYRQLCDRGVSGLTVYQETYTRDIYKKIHLAGPKKKFDERLMTLIYGSRAGMRTLGIGCLWGLAPWQQDFLALIEHAQNVQHQAWRSQLSFSFPRLKNAQGVDHVDYPLADRDLVKIICLTRLCFPEAHLALSTREPMSLRQHLAQIGITLMSAGSKTNPGAYSLYDDTLEQFSISDERSVAQITQDLQTMGFDVCHKDWQSNLHGALT